jgi:hypothetical protein
MWYVYIIRSIDFPNQEYIGASADLKQRKKIIIVESPRIPPSLRPGNWFGIVLFLINTKLWNLKKYLKSHCDKAFASKRFLN